MRKTIAPIQALLVFLVIVLSISATYDLVLAGAAKDFGVRGLDFKGQKQKTACRLVKEANITWHRGSVLWQDVVDNEGTFDWTYLDQRLKNVLKRGIKVMLTLQSVHPVFAPASGQQSKGYKKVWQSAHPCKEEDPNIPFAYDCSRIEQYKQFVRAVVERYDGDGESDAPFLADAGGNHIDYWQVENEPGKKPDEGSNRWNGNAEDYVQLFMVAQDEIAAADPEAKLALAGFTWKAIRYYLEHKDEPEKSFPYTVLERLKAEGRSIDIFDYHFYETYKKFPKIEGALADHLNFGGTDPGTFAEVPIWITETNVNKHLLDLNISETDYNTFVAKDIPKRFSTMFHQGVEKVFWHRLTDDPKATYEEEWIVPKKTVDEFVKYRGLTDKDLIPKPAYYTYELLIQKIKGKQHTASSDDEGATVVGDAPADTCPKVYRFGRGSEPDNFVYVMWYDPCEEGDPDTATINYPVAWSEVLITHVITEAGVTEPETEGPVPTTDGLLTIELTDSPVFVEKYRGN
jgi:hypothetical protein